jgi:hypothetical protein
MKLFYLFIISLIFLAACSDWGEDEDRFVNTYRDILAIRLIYPYTTVANPKVNKIYKHYGYTHESFKKEFFKYADNPELFNAMLDSARERARRDYIKFEKKEKEKQTKK